MNAANATLRNTTESHLLRIVEPLANYISAANRPQATLKSALAVLFREIEETHRVASTHVTTFSESHWS